MLPCVYWVIDRWSESENAASQKGGKQTASLILRRPGSFTAPSLVRLPSEKVEEAKDSRSTSDV